MVLLITILTVLLMHSVQAQSNVINLDLSRAVPTRFGNVTIKSNENKRDQIYLNNKLVYLGQDYIYYYLINKITRKSDDVLILREGIGGNVDENNNVHCKLMIISGKSQYFLSSITYCPNDDPISYTAGVIRYNFYNSLPYSFESDIGTLTFVANRVNITKSIKTDEYYRQLYANYTPKQIYYMISADNNSNAMNMINSVKENMWCHACGSYGARYCKPFNWIKNPPHDKYYQILKPICSKPIYGV